MIGPVERLEFGVLSKRIGHFLAALALTLVVELGLLILLFPVFEPVLIQAGFVTVCFMVVLTVLVALLDELAWLVWRKRL